MSRLIQLLQVIYFFVFKFRLEEDDLSFQALIEMTSFVKWAKAEIKLTKTERRQLKKCDNRIKEGNLLITILRSKPLTKEQGEKFNDYLFKLRTLSEFIHSKTKYHYLWNQLFKGE